MKIICFGDSNTWGFDPRDPFGCRYETIWPSLLKNKTGWNVINQGENGREIPRICVSFPSDTDMLVIMLGTNDLLQSQSPQIVCKRMEQFLISLHSEAEKILLVAPPPMTLGSWVPSHKQIEDSRSLSKYYHALAEQLGVRFVDAGQWNISIAFDGVHFTEEGHRVFAENLYHYLKEEILL